jgi:hypothetical protein
VQKLPPQQQPLRQGVLLLPDWSLTQVLLLQPTPAAPRSS